MDCKTVRMLVSFARPQASELDAVETEAFHAHVEDCSECRMYVEEEAAIEGRLAKAMRSVDVPAGLRERLTNALQRDRRIRHRRWLAGSVSAAAAVFLITLGVYLSTDTDAEHQVVTIEDPELVPVPIPEAVHPEFVEQWFSDRYGLRVKLPRKLAERWDFHFLRSKSIVQHSGASLPMLEFATDDAAAKVYVFSALRFDRTKVPDFGQTRARSHHLLGDPGEGWLALVIILKGDESEFLKPESRLIALK